MTGFLKKIKSLSVLSALSGFYVVICYWSVVDVTAKCITDPILALIEMPYTFSSVRYFYCKVFADIVI